VIDLVLKVLILLVVVRGGGRRAWRRGRQSPTAGPLGSLAHGHHVAHAPTLATAGADPVLSRLGAAR
jgi:hypothetical protein